MAAKLLQLNFTYEVTPAEYETAVTPLAESFASVDGLRWKIWVTNRDAREGGGIYLFEDGAAVGEFLDGPLAAAIRSHPAIRDVTAKVFDLMLEPTAVTRGPVAVSAEVSGVTRAVT